MNRRFLSVVACALLPLLLTACGGEPEAAAPSTPAESGPVFEDVEPDPIAIGVMPTGEALPLWVASRDGLFTEEGVEVQIVVFDAAADRDAAFAAGEIDAMVSNAFSAVQAEATGAPVALVAVAVEPSLVATAADVPDRSLSGVGSDRTFIGVSDWYLALPSGLVATRATLSAWNAAVARLQADPGTYRELLAEVARLGIPAEQVRVSATYPLAMAPSQDVIEAALTDVTSRRPEYAGVAYDDLVLDIGR